MAKPDPNDPSIPSAAHQLMQSRWTIIEHLLGGTETMRAAAEVYAPKHDAETDPSYKSRIAATTLKNEVENTLDTLVGKPFSKPVKIEDDVPAQMQEEFWDDVDMEGNSADVFLRQWFREGIAKAFAHVLVDFPKVEAPVEGVPRTLEDDRKQGVRPYWVFIKPENVLDIRAEIINGQEVLQMVRILEEVVEQDGKFGETCRPRIRVLTPGLVELYRKVEQKGKKAVWVVEDTWTTKLNYIPFKTFYSNRSGLMMGKPILLDLAYLNIAHWQSTSDQRHILTVTRFPILACSGASKDDGAPIVIGPNKILYNPDPQGQFYYVEHGGAAIEQGWKDLEKLEAQMSAYGAQYLQDRPGTQTATEKSLNTAESSQDLLSMVMVFEDAVECILDMTADWMNLPNGEGGGVQLQKDYNQVSFDPTGTTALQAARASKDISREALLKGLMARGILPEDFDIEADAQAIQDEPPPPGSAVLDLNPGEPAPKVPAEGAPPADKKPAPGTKPPGKTKPVPPGGA